MLIYKLFIKTMNISVRFVPIRNTSPDTHITRITWILKLKRRRHDSGPSSHEVAAELARAVRARSRAAHGNNRAFPIPAGPSRTGQHTLIRRNQCHRTPGELNKVSECSKKRRPGWKFWSKHIIQFTAGVRSVDCAAPTFKMGSFAPLLLARCTPGLRAALERLFRSPRKLWQFMK